MPAARCSRRTRSLTRRRHALAAAPSTRIICSVTSSPRNSIAARMMVEDLHIALRERPNLGVGIGLREPRGPPGPREPSPVRRPRPRRLRRASAAAGRPRARSSTPTAGARRASRRAGRRSSRPSSRGTRAARDAAARRRRRDRKPAASSSAAPGASKSPTSEAILEEVGDRGADRHDEHDPAGADDHADAEHDRCPRG